MSENTTEFEFDTITLPWEDGSETLCAVLADFSVEGQGYIALLAIDEEGNQIEDHPYFYQYAEDEDGEPILDDIESDEEYDTVVDYFEELWSESDSQAE